MDGPVFLLSAPRAVLLSFRDHTPPTIGLIERQPVRSDVSLQLLQRFGLTEGALLLAVERSRGVLLYGGVVTRPPYYCDDQLFAERAPLRAWFRLIRHVNARWFDGDGWRDLLDPHSFRRTLHRFRADFAADPRVRLDVIRRALGITPAAATPGLPPREGEGGVPANSATTLREPPPRPHRQRLLF